MRVCDVALDPADFLFFDKKSPIDIGNESTGSGELASFVGGS